MQLLLSHRLVQTVTIAILLLNGFITVAEPWSMAESLLEGESKICSSPAACEDLLRNVEVRIEKEPAKSDLYYRKLLYLMKLGRLEEGYKTAQLAMEKYADAKQPMIWLGLEAIDLGEAVADVHFNTTEDVRHPQANGLSKPLTFNVWWKDPSKPADVINFVVFYEDGHPFTAAIEREVGNMYIHDFVPTNLTYSQIREKVIELYKK